MTDAHRATEAPDDEAELRYQAVVPAQKVKARSLTGPVPGALAAGAAGIGAAAPAAQGAPTSAAPQTGAVSFGHQQLSADVQVDGVGRILEDPWGTDDDEYAVAGVDGALDDDDERRRRSATGMAVRGSGTRGAKKNGGAGGGPAGMPMGMGGAGAGAGAPGATVGGVGGPVGGLQAGGPQLGLLPAGVGGSGASGMPLTLLQTQQGAKAVSSAAYAPAPLPGGGVTAAGAGAMAYDPVTMAEALKANGYDLDAESQYFDAAGRLVGGDELVDTDGDGVPDTPRSGSGRTPGTVGPGGVPLPGGGSTTTPGTGPSGPIASGVPGTTVPGPGGTTTTPGPWVPGPVPGAPVPGPVTTPQPTPIPTTGSTPLYGSGNLGGGPQAANTPGSGQGGVGGAPYGSTGGTDFSVASDSLYAHSRRWQELSDSTDAIIRDMSSTQSGERMFGIISAPAAAYNKAVDELVTSVQASGQEAGAVSSGMNQSGYRYDDYEQSVVDAYGRVND